MVVHAGVGTVAGGLSIANHCIAVLRYQLVTAFFAGLPSRRED